MNLCGGLVADRSFRMRLHLDTFLRGVPSKACLDAFTQLVKHYLSVAIPLAAKSMAPHQCNVSTIQVIEKSRGDNASKKGHGRQEASNGI